MVLFIIRMKWLTMRFQWPRRNNLRTFMASWSGVTLMRLSTWWLCQWIESNNDWLKFFFSPIANGCFPVFGDCVWICIVYIVPPSLSIDNQLTVADTESVSACLLAKTSLFLFISTIVWTIAEQGLQELSLRFSSVASLCFLQLFLVYHYQHCFFMFLFAAQTSFCLVWSQFSSVLQVSSVGLASYAFTPSAHILNMNRRVQLDVHLPNCVWYLLDWFIISSLYSTFWSPGYTLYQLHPSLLDLVMTHSNQPGIIIWYCTAAMPVEP